MQYAPTRVRAKPARFHIAAHGYTKNAPDFTLPNRDTPKTYPVLDPNLRRKIFGGVCNTPLHGYMKNLPGFRPKPSARGFSGRMQYAPTRVHAKIVRFHISVSGHAKNAPDFTLPNRDIPKKPPGFRPKPSSRLFEGRMQYAPTRVRAKSGPVSYFRTRIRPNLARF